MKNCVLVLFSLFFVSNAASASDCLEYGKKAVTCDELGYLAESYDETGIDCGTQEETYIWTVKPSTNSSIRVSTLNYRKYGYMGGKAWESTCEVQYSNQQGQRCSFEMLVSLGTEDGSIDISKFKCRY